jgi:ribosomal protein S15P/S13E
LDFLRQVHAAGWLAVWANQWVLVTRHLATMFRDHLTRRTLEQMTAKLRDPS